jgi:hypothetical protein
MTRVKQYNTNDFQLTPVDYNPFDRGVTPPLQIIFIELHEHAGRGRPAALQRRARPAINSRRLICNPQVQNWCRNNVLTIS